MPKNQQYSVQRHIYIAKKGSWQTVSGPDKSPEWLLSLPEGVSLVMLSEDSVCFFWDEKGGVPALEKIAVAATSYAQTMA